VVLPPDLSAYTANEVLYGVAGGLSGGILICLIIIVMLLVSRAASKRKDVEKNELMDENSTTVNLY